ncbi:MAG: class I SAM-dependent methyltransferase [Bacteroidota bacterium]
MEKCVHHNDPLGLAYKAYLDGNVQAYFTLHSDMFDDDEVSVSYFFRDYADMPEIEKCALHNAYGKVLDVGAGTGSHSLYLQENGYDVTALDISPLACEVMNRRGVRSVVCQDFFSYSGQRFDTLLFLMNGIGLIESCGNFPSFFASVSELLREGGCIIIDSSDLLYLFEEDDGSFAVPLGDTYYGEVSFQVSYDTYISDAFRWVYVDFQTLCDAANSAGFACELLQEGKHYDYVARLYKK